MKINVAAVMVATSNSAILADGISGIAGGVELCLGVGVNETSVVVFAVDVGVELGVCEAIGGFAVTYKVCKTSATEFTAMLMDSPVLSKKVGFDQL